MKVSLDGKVALVTGGGTGIGLAIAEAFVDIGAKIVIAEIDSAKCEALRKRFPEGLIEQIDVCKVEQVDRLRASIEQRFDRLDVLVNNVGHHLNMFGKLETSREEHWAALYDINLRHIFVVCRALIPLMKRSGDGGSIINVSSIEGFRGYPHNVLYTTFKHGVTGITRGLATELAPENIRVNLIAPETTDSEQVPLAMMIPADKRAAADKTIPLGRFGKPSDHAGAAVFLATELSSWVTGSSLLVDGGGFNANVFQRTPDGHWTNLPVVSGMYNA